MTDATRPAVMDNTMPSGLVERVLEYEGPFTACDRERDPCVIG